LERRAGIVLAGGRSSRMGTPKAGLEWHGSTVLRRVAGILERALDGPVVVVRAAGQVLAELPSSYRVVEDERPGRGPLEALGSGLGAVAGEAEVAFVVSTDAPLLHPAFVTAVVGALGPAEDACVPVMEGVAQPLAAAYRLGVAGVVADLLGEDRLRVGLVLERCRVRRLSAADLLSDAGVARGDPRLESLINLNRADDYASARARPAPKIVVLIRSGPAGPGRGVRRAMSARAATLAGAAAAAGLELGGGIRATVNGRAVGEDGEVPLVEGDTVSFGRTAEASSQ
jgi:molybdopterin-guanine dinucleotide biosynthesis protein A